MVLIFGVRRLIGGFGMPDLEVVVSQRQQQHSTSQTGHGGGHDRGGHDNTIQAAHAEKCDIRNLNATQQQQQTFSSDH